MFSRVGLITAACGVLLAGCDAIVPGDEALVRAAQLVGHEALPEEYDNSGPGAAARGTLRTAVLETSQALRAAPCDADARNAYLDAFRDYAAAKMAMEGKDRSFRAYWSTREDARVIESVAGHLETGRVSDVEMARATISGPAALLAIVAAPAIKENAEKGRSPIRGTCPSGAS
jgi:hypothetical protein